MSFSPSSDPLLESSFSFPASLLVFFLLDVEGSGDVEDAVAASAFLFFALFLPFSLDSQGLC